MAWPENTLTTDEAIVTSFRPHWRLLVIPAVWFLLLSLGWFGVIRWLDVSWYGFVVYAALVLWLVASPFVVWWTTRYVLTTERLVTRRGLISKSGIEIPLERITNVNFAQTVIERLIGAGDLLVESAGESGQSAFRNIPRPDRFQTTLYRTREARSIALAGAVSAPSRGGAANAEAIQKLAELLEEGHISLEEYEQKRKELLEDM